MIRKLLLSTVAIAAAASTAFAADLPSRRAPPVYAPPPIPVFSWTGLYVGGDVGYAFGRDNNFLSAPTFGLATTFSPGAPKGVTGGGHIGYNLSTQSVPVVSTITSAISGVPIIGGLGGAGGVIGVEGDVKGSSYRAAGLIAGFPGSFETTRGNIQGTVRGRLGIAVDRALFFATGGVAFGTFRNAYADGLGDFASLNTTRVGWTVGGGVEYAFTNNLSGRVEYRYEDFGRYTQIVSAPVLGGIPFSFSHRDTENLVTVGFSYKFDTPLAPVVARY